MLRPLRRSAALLPAALLLPPLLLLPGLPLLRACLGARPGGRALRAPGCLPVVVAGGGRKLRAGLLTLLALLRGLCRLHLLPVLGRRSALHDLQSLPIALLAVAGQRRLVGLLLRQRQRGGGRSAAHGPAMCRCLAWQRQQLWRRPAPAAGCMSALHSRPPLGEVAAALEPKPPMPAAARTVLKVMKTMPRKRPVSGKVIMSRLSISPQ